MHGYSQKQPAFEDGFQFFTALFQRVGIRPHSLEIGNRPIEGAIVFQDFVLGVPHRGLYVLRQHLFPFYFARMWPVLTEVGVTF